MTTMSDQNISQSPHGIVCWSELNVHDVGRAQKFYSEALGWRFEEISPGGFPYWIIKAGDVNVGGLFHMSDPRFAGAPERWVTYIAVDSVDERIKKAVTLGAIICKEPMDIPGIGRIAMLKEPGGALVAWMTPICR
jgi:predicted enzyme related to lactoylglutathione lyase